MRLRRYVLVAAPFLIVMGGLAGYFIGYRFAQVGYGEAIYVGEVSSQLEKTDFGKLPTELMASIKLAPAVCYERGGGTGLVDEGFSYNRRIYRTSDFSNAAKLSYSRLLFEQKRRRYGLLRNLALSAHVQGKGSFSGEFTKLRSLGELFRERINITDDDVKRYYQSIQDQLPENMTLARMADNLRGTLFAKQRRALEKGLYQELERNASFSALLNEECPPALELRDLEDFTSYGSQSPEVPWHFVFFAQFACEECRASWDQLTSLVSIHPEKVRLTVIPFGVKEGSVGERLAQLSYCLPQEKKNYRRNYHSMAFGVPTAKFVPGLDLMDVVSESMEEFLKARSGSFEQLQECAGNSTEAHYRAQSLADRLRLPPDQPTLLVNGRLFEITGPGAFSVFDKIVAPPSFQAP